MNVTDSKRYRDSLLPIAMELPKKNCSIMITGASGLIGSCLIDVLLTANNNYGCNYHIYATGRSVNKLKKRFNSNAIDYLEIDFTKEYEINIKDLDYIVHLASNADPVNYSLYPAETMLVNIIGSKKLLDYCVNHNTRIFLASTFEVYGKVDSEMIKENEYGIINQNEIRSMYPESKRCLELLAQCYAKEYGINYVIGRMCSIYGPTVSMTDSKAQNQFIKKVLEKQNITLKSKGSQKRSYCYVLDAVSALLKILFDGEKCSIYNISNTNSITTIANIAEILAKDNNLKVEYDTPDPIEKDGFSKPMDCVLDDSKIRNLGWNDRYKLTDGLKETVSILKEVNNEI